MPTLEHDARTFALRRRARSLFRRRHKAIDDSPSIDARHRISEARLDRRSAASPPEQPAPTANTPAPWAARTRARAVGRANGLNPISIVVPCHRLIGADGNLVHYGGGLERKRWLIEHEACHA